MRLIGNRRFMSFYLSMPFELFPLILLGSGCSCLAVSAGKGALEAVLC